MPPSELLPETSSVLAADGKLSKVSAPWGSSFRPWPGRFWLASCGVHLVLFVAAGLILRDFSDVPSVPPLKVTVIGSSETTLLLDDVNPTTQSRLPERLLLPPDSTAQIAPVPTDAVVDMLAPPLPPPTPPERSTTPQMPEVPRPAVIEAVPDLKSISEPPPIIQPPRAVPTDRPLPNIATPTPLTPSPPVTASAPAPRLPQTAPRRDVPLQRRSSTTFDDAVVARTPPAPPERPSPPPKPLRAANARYGQNPPPAYPSEARRRGWEGTVLLVVEILETGRPERITVKQSSGHPVLDEAALGAVSRWTFIPAQQNGQPTRSLAEVPIVFSLRQVR